MQTVFCRVPQAFSKYEKSNFVVFHPVQKQTPKYVMLFLNNLSLTEEISTRYLRVYIDSSILLEEPHYYIARKIIA